MKDKILFAESENECFIKIIGKITYSNNTGFDDFINKYIKAKESIKVLIDLSETTYIDSTNLGIIGRIAELMYTRKTDKPVIISTRAKITDILRTMGFHEFFIIVKDSINFSDELKNIPKVDEAAKERALTILKAHQTLMNMNDKNKNTFKNVVEVLKNQIDKD